MLAVQGMHCTGCVVSLQRAMDQLTGIVTIDVSLKKSTMHVKFDKSQTTTQEIQSVVHAVGYSCSLI